jgi:small subunit ribosomal protein S8
MAPLYNLCSQIVNSTKWGFRRIAVPESKVNRDIVRILYDEGFISGVSTGDNKGPYHRGYEVPATPDNISRRRIWLDLKYRDGEPVLKKLAVISKPSRRVFATVQELKAVASLRNAGPLLKAQEVGQVTILDTPYGVIELKEALKKNVGGEVLCVAV